MKQNICIAITLLFLLGCGSGQIETDYVEGTFTYKGAPVVGAKVNFSPVTSGSGSVASGTTDAQGKYTLKTRLGEYGKGTTPGEYKVTVIKIEAIDTGKKERNSEGSEFTVFDYKFPLPAVYKSVSTTPLTATVKSGEQNVFNFDLVDNPK